MKRKKFARLCLVVAVAGLVVLYAAEDHIKKETISPSQISAKDVGNSVKVQGEAVNIYRSGGVTYFKLKAGDGDVEVADFQETKLVSNENLTVHGTVKMYRGDVQVNAARIDR